MIPKAKAALELLADNVVGGLAPQINDEYTLVDSLLISGLMKCLAQDFDRAAQVRMVDLQSMGVLFEKGLKLFEQHPLGKKLESYIARPAQSDITVTSLTKAHSEASELLILMHSEVEQLMPQGASTALNKEIWAYLNAHVHRHQYEVALG